MGFFKPHRGGGDGRSVRQFFYGVNSGSAGEADTRGRQTHDDESRIGFVSYFHFFSNCVNSGRAGEADARGRQTHDDESRIRFVSYFHSF
jgi:hypothetical protein